MFHDFNKVNNNISNSRRIKTLQLLWKKNSNHIWNISFFLTHTNKETKKLECFYIIVYFPQLNQCRFEVKNIFVQYSCTHSTTLNMQVSNNTFLMHDVSVDIFCLLSVKRLFIDFWIFISMFKWINNRYYCRGLQDCEFIVYQTSWLFIILQWLSKDLLNMY